MFEGARTPKGAANLGSLADHRASIERQTGRRLPEAVAPVRTLPVVLAHVWEWFTELAARRTGGPVGPNPITHGDIRAWAVTTGRDPTPEEVQLLCRMDDLAMTVFREAK